MDSQVQVVADLLWLLVPVDFCNVEFSYIEKWTNIDLLVPANSTKDQNKIIAWQLFEKGSVNIKNLNKITETISKNKPQ